MTIADKTSKHMPSFSRLLNNWYRKNARALPWRETRDPYKIWISEIMLQQTTVSAVIPYYQRWIKRFPKVEDVAAADPQELLKLWEGLGYYSRVRNIHACAKILSEDYHGKVPSQPHLLSRLPGFGPYTVGAVLSIAFDQRQPIIDANVRRVIMRILAREGKAEPAQDKVILAHLDKIMPKTNLRTFNQALMELGALICRSRNPLCLTCPVKPLCKAFAKGIQEIIPVPKKRTVLDIQVAIGIIQRGSKYYIQQRPSSGLLADLWEFPGGKIEEGESSKQALIRELKEEMGVEVSDAQLAMHVTHYYTQYRVRMHVYHSVIKGTPKPAGPHKWVTLKQMQLYPMPSGSAKIVDKLLNRYKI